MTLARAQNSEIGKRSAAQSRRAATEQSTNHASGADTPVCDITSRRQWGLVAVYVTSLVGAREGLSMCARLAPTFSLFLLCSFKMR